ncbi:hypothetical protein Sango_0219200 [Sesamum angolense]|uniref:C2 domain-containing protein n=1 Tax=Sesamum angolense TaxID=2727404 RepID=A0AAE1XHC7_9LAMI|nr:hypothetical protein Sango_0219200 [Sesamum angolense]
METHTILEINLITAQGLKTPSANLRRMQTYAVIWVNPGKKLRTRLDSLGRENPTWNDKFLFRVSNEFISGDTSAVSHVPQEDDTDRLRWGGSVRSSAFTAVQIRRPSGRFQGVLNIAAAVYDSSEFPILGKVSAVSFHELMDKKETESRRQRRLSLGGSKWSQQSSERESSDLSDGGDSTTSSSSTASTALKEWNCVRELAGNKGLKAEGGGLLCGLRKVPFCPSDQNLELWGDSLEGNV